jgi:hypothetical protein
VADPLQVNFNRGEITPLLHARVDLDDYKAGLAKMQNWVALRFGGMTRCPGTLLYGFAKNANKTARFLPFLFNRAQTYAIEAGDLYFRFWNVIGRVESPPGSAVEVVTPYVEADLPYIQVRQSGDLVFVFCVGYWPRVLTRTSETVWSLALYVPKDGPYLDINTTATTLDPSGNSGSVTITASAITGINGGTGFQTSDIGRPIRYFEATAGRWFWFVITARASTTSITATFMGRDDGSTAAMTANAATANWQLGAWSAYDGYPSAVGLYEERLISAGTSRQPTDVWGTVAQDTNLDDYSFQATVVADDGFTVRLTGGQLNVIQWVADGDDILMGTEGGLRVLGRNDENAAFGPLNIRQKKGAAVPTSYIPGFFIENVLIFLDVYRAKLYEALYSTESRGYEARELSSISEHLLGLGVTSVGYQAAPNKVLWMTTDNGLLLAATYDRDQKVFGVSQCQVGGDGFVEWVMSLPGTDADGDQVWAIVRRTLGGSVVRTVEYLSAFYREGYSVQPYPVYAFCSDVYSGVAVNQISGLTYAEGETFGLWADGVDLGDAIVEAGVLTLPNAITASTIVYGLRQSSLAHTLRVSDYGTGQPGLGKPLIASNAAIDVYQTAQIRVGAGALETTSYDVGLDILRWEDQSEYDPYGAAPLRTKAAAVVLDGSWENNGVCTIETNSMFPATIRALLVEVQGAD